MNRVVNEIKNRLSLRKPQKESLEILANIVDVIEMNKESNVELEQQNVIKLGEKYNEVKRFSEFERNFANICFTLATGVGKTRLMGAFITYLYKAKNVKNFFVLAPGTTIYNKLIQDLGMPSSKKYVFKGISEFTLCPPQIITGDNLKKRITKNDSIFNSVTINIFNMDKMNRDKVGIRNFSEVLGDSYFGYLKSLKDLVMLMDESHHYRVGATFSSIEQLRPILGIEVTATPYTDKGKFKNVVYEYSLHRAMEDGFVKEPAVATRKNFDPSSYDQKDLDLLKLQDGIRIHEDTKANLMKYAKDNDVRLVKPFVLVVAKDTQHAGELEKIIKSDSFFKGDYKNKVMQIHSQQKGDEKQENIEKLLTLENFDNEIEIVIHVNMLKEGWDITNLYTIIPLRTAAAMTLREQTIGRGLRLPYGKRTGDEKVDKLTIVSHDKFQEIIEAAQKEDSIIRRENIIDISDSSYDMQKKEVVTTKSKHDLQIEEEQKKIDQIEDKKEKNEAQASLNVKKDFYDVLPELSKFGKPLNKLTSEEVKDVIKKNKENKFNENDQFNFIEKQEMEEFTQQSYQYLDKELENLKKEIIEIPQISITPLEVKTWFDDFDLDTNEFHIMPISEEIYRKTLRENKEDTIVGGGKFVPDKLENIIVNELVNIPEVDYFENSKLLFKLANQIIEKVKTYLKENEIKELVQWSKEFIGGFIKPQLLNHFHKEITKFEAPHVSPFKKILDHNFVKNEEDKICDFRDTIEPVSKIPSVVFGNFKKAYHNLYKFDSKTEKDFAIILEDDSTVIKWLRPAPKQFYITWSNNNKNYEPDFVVETNENIYLVETKKAKDVESNEVREKTRAALKYCKEATRYTTQNGGKSWKYLLVPHDKVKINMNMKFFAENFECKE